MRFVRVVGMHAVAYLLGAALFAAGSAVGDSGLAVGSAGWICLIGVFTLGPLPLVLAERRRATVSTR